jgi:hypothetical protein
VGLATPKHGGNARPAGALVRLGRSRPGLWRGWLRPAMARPLCGVGGCGRPRPWHGRLWLGRGVSRSAGARPSAGL